MFIAFIIVSLFAATMLTTAYKDATTMTIPNWISLVVLGGFFAALPFVWPGWSDFGMHLLIGFGAFTFGFVLFALGWLGGGDAKLMAATSFWWMPMDLMLYVFYTSIAGGVMAILIFVGRAMIPAYMLPGEKFRYMIKEQTHMPYGLALAFGALATLPQSEIFKAAVGTL